MNGIDLRDGRLELAEEAARVRASSKSEHGARRPGASGKEVAREFGEEGLKGKGKEGATISYHGTVFPRFAHTHSRIAGGVSADQWTGASGPASSQWPRNDNERRRLRASTINEWTPAELSGHNASHQ